MRKLKKTGIWGSEERGERGDKQRSGRGRVGEDRRDQGAVRPNRGREDRLDWVGLRCDGMWRPLSVSNFSEFQ
ncbi:hypothetical protein NDU88_006770 [Pleurodeles waltl]|uniref:Uncharacterized protein n=1 Tax=Pleurodeles waltl TaxID=8319 RepID=A0AAV7TYJ8_PLEWA|nr:hypothetical protein NDU88_006770 [Pleurodeles waltl]